MVASILGYSPMVGHSSVRGRLFGDRYLREASAVVFATQRELEKAKHVYDCDIMYVVH